MKLHYSLFACVLFMCCNTSKQHKLEDFMVGSWQTEYLKIEMPTVNKSDSLSVIEEDFSAPNAGLAQSTYRKDGEFSSWFLLANGKKSGETVGKWKAKGNDSLFVDYFYHGKQVKAWYRVVKTSKGFDASVLYDWDNDGENDDKLFMKTKRIILE